MAALARYTHVYVQDDDCIVDIHRLHSFYQGDGVCSFMRPEAIEEYEGLGVHLVGWGSFFNRRLVLEEDVFERWDARYTPEDKLGRREADRVFSYFARPGHIVTAEGRDVVNLPWANDKDRMSREWNHHASRAEAIKRCSLLGGI